ncbi:MAG TPA: hypothetical protein PKX00_15600, partial [Opitutaceae bacterium]|nr:hypothetical protein [Opitutaceae bacterium]
RRKTGLPKTFARDRPSSKSRTHDTRPISIGAADASPAVTSGVHPARNAARHVKNPTHRFVFILT